MSTCATRKGSTIKLSPVEVKGLIPKSLELDTKSLLPKNVQLGQNQLAFNDRIDLQCKGRNGYFWPVAATIHTVPNRDATQTFGSAMKGYVMVDIEGSQSIKGAQAPISIRLSPEDAKRLALWMLEKIAEESREEQAE